MSSTSTSTSGGGGDMTGPLEVPTISQSQINFAGVFAYAWTIPGTLLCFTVLLAYALVAIPKHARKHLDRVSFRLLVYSLISNVFFGIAYAATPTSPGRGCKVGAFFVNLTLSFATFFTTCIAINLQLVLIHGINGKSMEKFYVIGTSLLSLVLNIPTVALDQFGWNDTTYTCWYGNPNHNLRLRWIIGTQSFWITLAATIELVCSLVVLLWLFRFMMAIKNLMDYGLSTSQSRKNPLSTTSLGTTKPTRLSSSSSSSRNDHENQSILDDPRFRGIVLRIALYPIVSMAVNYSTVILDLIFSMRGVNTQYDFRLLVLDLTLYGLRTLAYGLIAIFDPSFLSAVKAIYRSRRTTTSNGEKGITLTKLDFGPGVGSTSLSNTASGTACANELNSSNLQTTTTTTTASSPVCENTDPEAAVVTEVIPLSKQGEMDSKTSPWFSNSKPDGGGRRGEGHISNIEKQL